MIEKITMTELGERLFYRDFTAEVTAVHKTAVNLRIDGKTYSIKMPKDFKDNKVQEDDTLDITWDMDSTPSMAITAIYENGRKLYTTERMG